MHYDNTAKHFQTLIEHLSLSVDAIADVLGEATESLVQCICNEQKVFSCGAGLDACTANLFSELLRSGAARERPTLPVIELAVASAPPLTSAVTRLCEQLGALGQPGDYAVIFGSCLDADSIRTVETMLGRRQMPALWVGTQGSGPSLVFPGTTATTALSLSHAGAFCLAELVDITMFGPLEDLS